MPSFSLTDIGSPSSNDADDVAVWVAMLTTWNVTGAANIQQ
jgi:hypothetical protein